MASVLRSRDPWQAALRHRRTGYGCSQTPSRFRVSFGLLSLLLLGMVSRGAAQGASVEHEAEARERFDRGVALYGEGNLDAALVQLERAYELVPNYRVLYNLAQIQAERHEYVAALSYYERYLEQGGEEVPAARRTESLEQIKILRDSIAQLWVESDVEGAKLFVDDEAVGDLPLREPIAIDSGVRHLRVEKPGYAPAFRKLKVAGGDQPRLSIPLVRLAAEDESGPAGGRTDPSPAPNYKPLWIAAASTLALGGATLTFGLLARGANRDLDQELDRFPARPDVIHNDRATVKTYAGLSDGFGIASVLSLGVSLYLLIAPPKQRTSAGKDLARGAPSVSLRDGHLGLRGVF